MSLALLPPVGVHSELVAIGEVELFIFVVPTKWKFSWTWLGDWSDCGKLVNPPCGYIMKNEKTYVQCKSELFAKPY